MSTTALPSKIEIPVWRSERVLTFERTEDVISWAETQLSIWPNGEPGNAGLKATWNQQRSKLEQLVAHARNLEMQIKKAKSPQDEAQIAGTFQALSKVLNGVRDGQILTTENPSHDVIIRIFGVDPDAAAVLLMASRSDGQTLLANTLRQSPPFDAMARVGVSAHVGNEESSRVMEAHRRELAELKNKAERDISELRQVLDDEISRSIRHQEDYEEKVGEREGVWEGFLSTRQEEWDKLKAFYQTELGLRAPTEYWRTRSSDYRKSARNYGVAFGCVLAVLLAAFIWLGIGELRTPQADSPLLTALVVGIPAFAGIWILRILGRQLSESLMIMKDAKERETLVTTFLAMMNEDIAGKSAVKDEDRALILHALFRPSSVTATDDSPPLHVIDAMLRRR